MNELMDPYAKLYFIQHIISMWSESSVGGWDVTSGLAREESESY